MYRAENYNEIVTTNGLKINAFARVDQDFKIGDLNFYVVGIVGDDVICAIKFLPDAEMKKMKLKLNYSGRKGETNVYDALDECVKPRVLYRRLELYKHMTPTATLSGVLTRLGLPTSTEDVSKWATSYPMFSSPSNPNVKWVIDIERINRGFKLPYYQITYYDAGSDDESVKTITIPEDSKNLHNIDMYVRPYLLLKTSDFSGNCSAHHAIGTTVYINREPFQVGDSIWIPGFTKGLTKLSFNPIADSIFNELVPKQMFIVSATSSILNDNEAIINLCEVLSCDTCSTIELNLARSAYSNFVGFKTEKDCKNFIAKAKKSPKIAHSSLASLGRKELLWAIDHPECIVNDEEDKTDEA